MVGFDNCKSNPRRLLKILNAIKEKPALRRVSAINFNNLLIQEALPGSKRNCQTHSLQRKN